MADPNYKFIGSHAEEIAGIMRAPGDTFVLNSEALEDLAVKTTIADGKLLNLSTVPKTEDVEVAATGKKGGE